MAAAAAHRAQDGTHLQQLSHQPQHHGAQLLVQQLRRCVLRGAAPCPQDASSPEVAQTEVSDDRVGEVLRQEDVIQFDVPVDNPTTVDVIHSLKNLAVEHLCLVLFQTSLLGPALVDEIDKISSGVVVHGKTVDVAIRTNFV